MLAALLRRFAQAAMTLFLASVLVWSLQVLVPGNPAQRILIEAGISNPTNAEIAQETQQIGLAGPPWSRYVTWLWRALHGDLGQSWLTGRPVTAELGDRLPATARLAIAALALAIIVSLTLAIASALGPGRLPDHVSRIASILMISVPSFVIAVVLLDIVVIDLKLGSVITDGTWGTVLLPAACLALAPAAIWSRILRASLLEARSAAYLHVSAARGATRTRQMIVHALPNALVPFLNVVGIGTAGLLAGAPVVETVFNWPGVGRYTVIAIDARDVPVVQGYTLLAVFVYVVVSLVVDVVVRVIDPRLRPGASHSSDRRRRGADVEAMVAEGM